MHLIGPFHVETIEKLFWSECSKTISCGTTLKASKKKKNYTDVFLNVIVSSISLIT